MRIIPLIPILVLAACGSTSVTRSVTTTTTVPTTINGVEVTPENILDLADIDAEQIVVDGEVVTQADDATDTESAAEDVTDTAGAASEPMIAPDTATAFQYGGLAIEDFERILGDGFSGGIPGTSFAQIPSSGSATFVGPAILNIYERVTTLEGDTTNIVDTATVSMVGTSSVEYDFGSDEFSGTVDDLFAIQATTFATDLVLGEISISNGVQTDPDSRPTALAADASGSLTAFEQTYDIDLDLNGLLRGTNPGAEIPVKALNLQGLDGTIAGSSLLVDLDIVGDRDAANNGAFVNR